MVPEKMQSIRIEKAWQWSGSRVIAFYPNVESHEERIGRESGYKPQGLPLVMYFL